MGIAHEGERKSETDPVNNRRGRRRDQGRKEFGENPKSVSSPAQPSPRLASVTPSCVTERSRSGLCSKLIAACAPTLSAFGKMSQLRTPRRDERNFRGREKSINDKDQKQKQ